MGAMFMPLAIGASMLGTVASAEATLASGKAAQQGADYQAKQLEMNAAGERAAGQRRMFERQDATRRAIASSRTRAAASGVDPGAGSALTNEQDLAARGEYQALLEMWGGENEATGLENKAQGVRFEGEMKRRGARLAALGTLAGGVGATLGGAGKYYFPSPGRT